MNNSRIPGTGHDSHGKPTPPPANVNAAPDETGRDDVSGYGGGSLVGSNVSGLDAAANATRGTTHEEYRDTRNDASDGERDRDVPIGSALASASGISGDHRGSDPTSGADADLTSGPSTLGATTGGERAVAGRADANRNSRDHGNSRGI